MSKFFGLDRLGKLLEIVRRQGGVKNAYLKLFRTDELKLGTLVGTDKYGNKYFENPYYFYGRNRWVEFSDRVGFDYDGSQIPAEWFGWMHYKTDLPPNRDGSRPKHKWMADHSENLSGTAAVCSVQTASAFDVKTSISILLNALRTGNATEVATFPYKVIDNLNLDIFASKLFVKSNYLI